MVSELYEKWQDYLFLTKEMKKFLVKRDLDLFFSLLKQRQNLQEIIEKNTDKMFYTTTEGRNLLVSIQQENQIMMMQFNSVFNGMKKRENVAQAYEGMSNFAGGFINNKT